MIYQFRVAQNVYEFEADNFLDAMAACNRQVMDGLNLSAFAWYDGAAPNSFYCGLGNNFD